MRYESATGKRYEATTVIDMAEWKGAQQLGTPSIHKIANSIDRIQRDIGHLASGFRRLGINVYTQDDRDQENDELRQRFEDERRKSNETQDLPLGLHEPTEQPDTEDGPP